MGTLDVKKKKKKDLDTDIIMQTLWIHAQSDNQLMEGIPQQILIKQHYSTSMVIGAHGPSV